MTIMTQILRRNSTQQAINKNLLQKFIHYRHRQSIK